MLEGEEEGVVGAVLGREKEGVVGAVLGREEGLAGTVLEGEEEGVVGAMLGREEDRLTAVVVLKEKVVLEEEGEEVAKLDALNAPPVSMAEAAELGVSVCRMYILLILLVV